MHVAPSRANRGGFTLVELMLAMALGVMTAAILALLLRSLLAAGDGQSTRIQGPFAARQALRTIVREVSCAFAPPVKDLAALELSATTEPGKPQVRLAFFVPVAQTDFPGAYDIHQVAYEVHALNQGLRELRRIAAPCSGPFTNAPVTNIVLQGHFTLAITALTNGIALAEWPPPVIDTATPALPTSLSLSLDLRGENTPFQTEALIQAATGIRSPLEREPATEPAGD